MPRTVTRTRASLDARMLAAADRLFDEFDHLPVRTVFRAIGAARAQAREQQGIATPELVETLARAELLCSGPPAASAAALSGAS